MQNISRYLEIFCNDLILRFPFHITFPPCAVVLRGVGLVQLMCERTMPVNSDQSRTSVSAPSESGPPEVD